jgi:hypothetical protein
MSTEVMSIGCIISWLPVSSQVRESISRSLLVSAAASCVLTLNQDALCIVCLSAVVCSLQCLLGGQSYMHHRR